MRLGVVMTGVGVQAAANVGVLRALEERGMEPHCVCGLMTGAWPAALFAVGKRPERMLEDVRMAAAAGRRLLAPAVSARRLLVGDHSIFDGKRIERLLLLQAGNRMLSLCERPAVFPCRQMRGGQRTLFATRPLDLQIHALPVMHAAVSFTARAAMTLPPFLVPLEYMGSPLLWESNAAFSVKALRHLGAQRVIVICVQAFAKKKPDALDLVASALQADVHDAAQEAQAELLQVVLPDTVGAADASKALACEEAGYTAAQAQLDALLGRMGMARCRVLAFERRVTEQRR